LIVVPDSSHNHNKFPRHPANTGSHLVSSGLSLELVGRLLGHTTATTTKRYAHLADDPLRAATERFGAKIAALRTGVDAEIVPLKSKG
jgi:integrase